MLAELVPVGALRLATTPAASPTPAEPPSSGTDVWHSVTKWFVGIPLQLLIIVAVSVAIIFISHRLINKGVERLIARAAVAEQQTPRRAVDTGELTDGLLGQRRRQRAEAIGALLRSAVTAFVVCCAVLMVLPLFGVNIVPLLASASVLGVALGFGAQGLVKDYLAGIFIVVEDQYGVGDLVDISGVLGTVEDVSLRVTRLRDLTGVVWYVRNGEILTVANRSQGWTLATADIPVAADTDLDKVRAVVSQVSKDMMADPALDNSLLDAPRYAGVESVSGEAVFVRVVAKAAPEKQLPVGRALREQLKQGFDEAGITIPVVNRMMTPGGAPAAAPKGASGGTGAGGAST